MGSLVMWLLAILGLLVLALACVYVLARRRLQKLRVGGIDVALRIRTDDTGRGWHLGIAHYRGEEFAWYRALSLRSGPDWVLNRGDVEITARRVPSVAEAYQMPNGSTVLRLSGVERRLEVAMGSDALTGFLSWLESAPPGRSVPWAS